MNFFTKYYLLASKNSFPNKTAEHDELHVIKAEKNYLFFKYLFEKVGYMWKWPERPKYWYNQQSLKDRLYDEKSQLFLFKKNEKIIGYCFASQSEEAITNQYSNIIEVENFGLFPEYTGKGYGNYLLQTIFTELFKTYDHVFLTTRSTNHEKVVSFYKNNGMKLIHQETLPDDVSMDEMMDTPIAA